MSTIETLQPGFPVPLFTFCGKLIESGWFGWLSMEKKRNSTVSRGQLLKVGEKETEETTAGGQTTLCAI